jgi:sugar phosphate isomerase/epimerase
MRLGVSSYTYVWGVGVPGYEQPPQPLTPAGLLAKAVGLGVRALQIADNLPLDRLSDADRLALRQGADEHGIELEVGTAGIASDLLSEYLAIARQLRSGILRTVIDTPGDHPEPAEVVERLRPVLPAFAAAGVTLAIENHDRYRAETLRRIVVELNSPAVGICLDTANSIGCLEGPEQVVETLGRHVVSLHLKDVQAFRPPHLKGFVVEGRPAGQGQVDFPWLLHRLRQLGSYPNAILELWPAPLALLSANLAQEDAWAEASVRYLRRFIPD